MAFKGDGWSVVLLSLDGSDVYLRQANAEHVSKDFRDGVRYYFLNGLGEYVNQTRNVKELEQLARERDGCLHVSKAHPRSNVLLYERLKPKSLLKQYNEGNLKPLDDHFKTMTHKMDDLLQETKSQTKPKGLPDQFTTLNQTIESLNQKMDSILEEMKSQTKLKSLQDEFTTRNQRIGSFLQDTNSPKKHVDALDDNRTNSFGPSSGSKSTVLDYPNIPNMAQLQETVESLRQENKELRAMMNKLTDTFARVVEKSA